MLVGGKRRSRPAQYAQLGDADQLGNIFKSIGHAAGGIVKGVGSAATATAHLVPKAGSILGKATFNAAFLPVKLGFDLAKNSLVGGFYKTGGGGGGGAGGGGEPAPASSSALAPPPSITSTGGGASYGGGGGYGSAGGGGDDSSALEKSTEQPLTIAETGMPMWQKVALGAAALGGAFLLYKKFGKGGRSARRSKSR